MSKAASTSTFGCQVADSRFDELDLVALQRTSIVCTIRQAKVLDLGCGVGALSAAFAQYGANVVAVDRQDFGSTVAARMLQTTNEGQVRFLQGAVPQCLEGLQVAGPWDIVYSQRMLHYLTHHQARQTLVELRRQCRPGGSLFLGVSGMYSELSQGYLGADSPPEGRFSVLHPNQQSRHGITQPVCLYTPTELELLVKSCEFEVTRVWLSPFGNVKLEANTAGGGHGGS